MTRQLVNLLNTSACLQFHSCDTSNCVFNYSNKCSHCHDYDSLKRKKRICYSTCLQTLETYPTGSKLVKTNDHANRLHITGREAHIFVDTFSCIQFLSQTGLLQLLSDNQGKIHLINVFIYRKLSFNLFQSNVNVFICLPRSNYTQGHMLYDVKSPSMQ